MTAVEAGQTTLGSHVAEILSDRSGECGSVINGFGERISGAERYAAIEALGETQHHAVVTGISDGRVVGKAGGVADGQTIFRVQRRARRSAVGREIHIEIGAFCAGIRSLDKHAVTEIVLNGKRPCLRVGRR